MAERKPRDPEDLEYTGTGTSRSGDMGPPRDARTENEKADKAAPPNRSGSGGSGDEQDDEGELPAD